MKDEERPPLRIVLRNFLNHIETLESQISSEKSYDIEFQALKLFSESVKGLKEYSCIEGEKEINRKKNRYKDILPFDVSRVVLQEHNGIPGSDYINANYIKGASGSPAYIASQGPLPCTVNDFWRMVVQCEVHVIVMACNQEEAGKTKCEKYWVDEGEERHFGKISVRLLNSSTVCPDFSVRTMRLKYSNATSMAAEERTVCQVHYVAWPDHGVPSVVHPLLDMVRLVRDTQASETLPVLVHCSAGCGRTGTICAIDYVFGLLRTGKLTADFSLSSLIRDMRRQRIAMVQTKEQYVLVHQAVRELFREQLSVIDSHPYENVDPDGTLLIKREENIYDTIDFSEEKGDFKMEKEKHDPLNSGKKSFTLYSSKQEKEVENLTEQLRSVQAGSKSEKRININSAPQLIKNHYTSKLPCKPELERKKDNHLPDKPIPAKGILRVPLLPSYCVNHQASGSSLVPIKRSKSLKIMPIHKENVTGLRSPMKTPAESQQKTLSGTEQLITSPVSSLDSDVRRSSLESTNNTPTTTATQRSEISSGTKKRDVTHSSVRKQLIRSYTTLDMRHKFFVSSPKFKFSDALNARSPLNSMNTSVCEPSYEVYEHVANVRLERNKSQLHQFSSPSNSSEPPPRPLMGLERSSKRLNLPTNSHYSGSSGSHSKPRQHYFNQHPLQKSNYHQLQQPFKNQNALPHKNFPSPPAYTPEKSKILLTKEELKDRNTRMDNPDTVYLANKPQKPAFGLRRPNKPSMTQNVLVKKLFIPSEAHQASGSRAVSIENSNFETAPGVDIDQVAASMPQIDGSKSNLMKVALEAFHSKKAKPPSTTRNVEVTRGPLLNYPVCRKKQQQYL